MKTIGVLPSNDSRAHAVVVVDNEATRQHELVSHRIRRFRPNQPPTENAEIRSTRLGDL